MPAEGPPSDFKDRLKASYDAMAPTYNDWTERHNHLRMGYLEDLYGLLPKLTAPDQPSNILELGCGAGKPFLEAVLTRGPRVTATANDLSDTQIDLARANLAAHGDRVRFVPGDMTELSFADGSLTAVVALYSIIHLARDEQAAMLPKIARWLEPGGCLLANFSLTDTEGSVAETWLHEKGWMFWSGLGVDGTIADLKKAGLTVEKQVVEGDSEEKFLWIIARRQLLD